MPLPTSGLPPLLQIALVLVGGIAMHWLAWALRLPSILLLLGFGLVLGPLAGWVATDALLGDLLQPGISLAVAAILFEGGLGLRLAEIRPVAGFLARLLTLGAALTFLLTSACAWLLLDLPTPLALLIGAFLVVTGPTVIGPLLRHVRPSGRVGPLLLWEGITIDPIGVLLSLLVFEVVAAGAKEASLALAVLRTVLAGGLLGLGGAQALLVSMRRYWLPDTLVGPAALAMALLVAVAANQIQEESGLLAVTLLGIRLANQRAVPIRSVLEFMENLRTILIAGLFVLLAARVPLAQMQAVLLPGALFTAALIVLVRPASVFACGLGSGLGRRELLFVAAMAPRGIVAASVASVFALRLQQAGIEGAERLAPAAILAILGTVVFYGLFTPWFALRLGLSRPDPQGLLVVGAHGVARELLRPLQQQGIRVVLVDKNPGAVREARMAGFEAVLGDILDERLLERLDLGGVGKILAMTPNEDVNALALLHFQDLFGRVEAYRVAPEGGGAERRETPVHLRGRVLFPPGATLERLAQRLRAGAVVKATRLTPHFTLADHRREHGDDALPLFVVRASGRVAVWTNELAPTAAEGDLLVALVGPAAAPRP